MAKKAVKLVAEIALYGRSGGPSAAIISWKAEGKTQTRGIGYGGQFGEVLTLSGQTEALWKACDALRELGFTGNAAVHIQVGDRPMMAVCSILNPGYFGSLKFGDGVSYVISAEDIEKAFE